MYNIDKIESHNPRKLSEIIDYSNIGVAKLVEAENRI